MKVNVLTMDEREVMRLGVGQMLLNHFVCLRRYMHHAGGGAEPHPG